MNKAIAFLGVILLFPVVALAPTLNDQIDALPSSTANKIVEAFEQEAFNTVTTFYKANIDLIGIGGQQVKQDDVSKDFFNILVWLVGSIAAIVFAFVGLKFMTAEGAQERNQAKEQLKGAVSVVVIVAVSSTLFSWVLNVENSLASSVGSMFLPDPNSALLNQKLSIWPAQNPEQVIKENLFLSLFYGFSLAISGFTLMLRHLYVFLSGILFPVFIFLFFMPVETLRKAGELFLKALMILILIPFFDSFLLFTLHGFMSGLKSTADVGVAMLAFGFLTIGVFNIVVTYLVLASSSVARISFYQLPAAIGKALK